MRRFDIYVLRQLSMLFGFFALVLVLVYWINRAVRLFDQVIADGQSALVFLELSLLSLPPVIQLVSPIAGFAATVYVINRLSSDSELVIMQATGFSARQLARPVFAFGVIVCLFMAILTHYLEPISKQQLSLRQGEISQNVTARLLTDGKFMHPRAGMSFYIGEITPEGELKNVFLSDTSGETRITYIAKRAFLVRSDQGPKLVLIDGMQQRLDQDTRLSLVRFNDFVVGIDDLAPNITNTRILLDRMSTFDILNHADDLSPTQITPAQITHEIQDRNLKTLLTLIAILIGYATLIAGGFSRFGIWQYIFISIILMVFVKITEGFATNIVRNRADLWLVLYTPFVIGGLIVWGLLLFTDTPWRQSKGANT